jgi:hypothetical protein
LLLPAQLGQIAINNITLKTPENWSVSKATEPKEVTQIFFRRETAQENLYFNVKVPDKEKPTQPYWLENERKNFLYNLQNHDSQNLPFQMPLVKAEVEFEINYTKVKASQPVEYRFADDIRGEIRRNLNVLPKISLSIDQNLLVIARRKRAQIRKIVLSIKNNSSSPVCSEARLNLPEQLKVSPQLATFNLENKGEKTSARFNITFPAKFNTGDFELSAQAAVNGKLLQVQ